MHAEKDILKHMLRCTVRSLGTPRIAAKVSRMADLHLTQIGNVLVTWRWYQVQQEERGRNVSVTWRGHQVQQVVQEVRGLLKGTP